MPQSTQRYLHRAAARTTTGRVHLGLVGSSYEIMADGKRRFHDWNSRSDWWVELLSAGQVGISLAAAISVLRLCMTMI